MERCILVITRIEQKGINRVKCQTDVFGNIKINELLKGKQSCTFQELKIKDVVQRSFIVIPKISNGRDDTRTFRNI